MLCSVLTLFPEAIRPYLDESILGIAQRTGRVRFHLVNIRDYSRNPHNTVDDRPFGGGPGMVLAPEPIFDAVEDVERSFGAAHRILLTPRGRRFDQSIARDLTHNEHLLLCCGRYEGFDERIRLGMSWNELSLGDFVLSGGEIPALAILEATIRLLPGVLGHDESAEQDSFGSDGLLDHPHFTRPRVFRGMTVPDVLLSGDHASVERWRRSERERLTRAAASTTRPALRHEHSRPERNGASDPCEPEQD
ncbi:MAG: tRNA (guanosine(37)-N1)-methyltransferase TrmD [Planctomycetes bacterium]|nr:tRNA (guanosine(37)-N1)-methyltransferase TrmD [Planctomycetota bacterium]MCB9917271.1 tRNA (guanosine(37)-N1)-methyltransferase TrmD [Planctomycetota bacterium]